MAGQAQIIETEIEVPGEKSGLRAFLAHPREEGPRPAILVIHEIYGLTEHIRDITRRFAHEGYAALAVDLFAGRNKAICIARFMTSAMRGSTDHSGIRDLEAALAFLASQSYVDPKRLGAIGFCLGGGFALALACREKSGAKRHLKAIAPFYGMNPRPLEEIAGICPVVGSYGEKDSIFTKAARKLDEKLTEFKIEHDVKIYPGARHSFMNKQSKLTYAPEAAQDAWKRTLDFFAKHI